MLRNIIVKKRANETGRNGTTVLRTFEHDKTKNVCAKGSQNKETKKRGFSVMAQLSGIKVIKFYKQLTRINQSTKDICERFGLHKYLKTQTSHLSLIFAIVLLEKHTFSKSN